MQCTNSTNSIIPNITPPFRFGLTLVLFLTLFSIQLKAQDPIKFIKSFGETNKTNYPAHVLATPDGGYLLDGSSHISGIGNDELIVIKTDKYGDTLWTRIYDGPGKEAGQGETKLLLNGNYLLASTSSSYGYGASPNGYFDIILLEIEPNGNLVRTVTYGGTNRENVKGFIQFPDSSFLFYGETKSIGAGNEDIFLMRLDKNFDTIFIKTYGDFMDEVVFDLKLTPDGGYILAGHQEEPFAGGPQNTLVMKTDSMGNVQWAKNYYSSTLNSAGSIDYTSDGGYLVAGYGLIGNLGQFFMLKIDSLGNMAWQKSWNFSKYLFTWKSIKLKDGNFVYTLQSAHQGILLKTDENGNILWVESFSVNAILSSISVDTTIDGGFILVGRTKTSNRDNFSLIKVDSLGDAGCADTITNTLTTSFNFQTRTATLYDGTGQFLITHPTMPNYSLPQEELTFCITCTIRDTVYAKLCPGDTIAGYYEAGSYIDTFLATNGCISIRTLYLNNGNEIVNNTINITNGDSVFVGGAWQTMAGTYVDTFSNLAGCDSVVVTELTISVGLLENTFTESRIYPNPARDEVMIDLSTKGKPANLYLVNYLGEQVLERIDAIGNITFDISSLPSGIYLLQISTLSRVTTQKLFVE